MENNKTKSPLKAIREFCIECNGGVVTEVRTCTAPNCPLYAYRMGKNPYAKRNMTDEQKQAAKERLQRARESKIIDKNSEI